MSEEKKEEKKFEVDYTNLKPINIDEIIAVAKKAEKKLSILFTKLMTEI